MLPYGGKGLSAHRIIIGITHRSDMNIFSILTFFFALTVQSLLNAAVDEVTKAKIVTQTKVRKDLDDTKAVESALFRDPVLTTYAKNIHVESADGIVTLTGFVPAVELKTAIERTTLAVPGITSVLNYIEIKGNNTTAPESYKPEA